MDKQTVLDGVRQLLKEGALTKEELLEACGTLGPGDLTNRQSRLSAILYYIGGAIIAMGVGIFISNNWQHLNSAAKILATLGSSLALYCAGILMGTSASFKKVSDAFYFISALVAPLGIFITMDIGGVDIGTSGSHSVIAAVLFFAYLCSYLIQRRNVFVVFSVIFGTWLFFSFTSFLLGEHPFTDWEFIKYRWLAAGVSHILLGYAFTKSERKSVSPWLYGFGVFGALTAALALGGWSPKQNTFWELTFPGINIGVIFLSVFLRVRSFLVFGALFLMAYILKITFEYFTTGFGWALSLIVVGFLLIGIGYYAFYLNRKYLSS